MYLILPAYLINAIEESCFGIDHWNGKKKATNVPEETSGYRKCNGVIVFGNID